MAIGDAGRKLGEIIKGTAPIQPIDPVDSMPDYVPPSTKAGGSESLNALKIWASENGYEIDTGTNGDSPAIFKWQQVPAETDAYGEIVKPAGTELVRVNPASDPVAKSLLQQFNSYSLASDGVGVSSSSGGGSGASAKYADPILAYLNSGEVALEQARSGEISRQMKDALTRLDALYQMEDADQNYEANAIQGNLAQEKAWRSGAADWESPGARTMIGSRPNREIEQALQEQLALSLPDTIMPDYGMAGILGIQGRQGYDDSNFGFGDWYAEGTRPASEVLPRYADGTSFTNNPFLNMPAPTLPWTTSTGVNTGNTATPGMYNSNQFLPASQQTFGGQEWDALALATMLKNIKEGNAGAPVGWSGSNLANWSGQDLPPSMQAELATWIRNNGTNADLTYMLGARPADRGSAYSTVPLTPQEQQTYDLNNFNAWMQLQNLGLNQQKYIDSLNAAQGAGSGSGGGGVRYGGSTYIGGAGSQMNYGGTYGGSAAEGDPDLKEKLALEYAKLKVQETYQMGVLEEDKLNGVFDRAYKEALTGNIKDQYSLQLQQFAEDQVNNTFNRDMQTKQFEEQLRRAAVEEQQRQQELGIKRGGVIAQLGADPGDAVARSIFAKQGVNPLGDSQDAFTGQSTGQKTWDQLNQENAPIFWGNNNRQTLETMFSGGPINDSMFIVGDRKGRRPTGYEEVVINHTGAPLDVLSNKESVKAGLVPAKGRR